jgi:hypothetical protein
LPKVLKIVEFDLNLPEYAIHRMFASILVWESSESPN